MWRELVGGGKSDGSYLGYRSISKNGSSIV